MYRKLSTQNSVVQIYRPALLSELGKKFSRYRILLINAPAGAGKSTILKQFTNADRPHIWYNTTPEGADPDDKAAWNLRGDNILQALSYAGKDKIYLIIDNAHRAGNHENFWAAVDFLIQNLPDNLYIAILSRNKTAAESSSHILYNRAGRITGSSLGFSMEEIQQLFYEKYDFPITKTQAEQVYELCAGWPLGVNLIADYLSNSDKDGLLRQKPHGLFLDNVFSEYLTEEYLKCFSQSTQNFLINSSMFDCFNVDMCEEILEEKNSAQIVNSLLEDGLLLEKPGPGGTTWFKYPALFREFFRRKLSKNKSALAIYKMHEITGLYFASRDLPAKAMRHYLKAHAYEKAAGILEKHMEHFIVESAAAEVIDVVDKFPKSWISTKPVVCLAKGWALFFLGDWHKSLHFLKKARYTAGRTKHTGVLGWSILFGAYIYFSQDNYLKLVSFLKKWLQIFPQDNPVYPDILLMLALGLGQLGCMDEAGILWEKIEKHPFVFKNPQKSQRIKALKSYNYSFLTGDLRQAEQGMAKGVELLQTNDHMGIYARILGYYSSLKYVQGFFDKCSDLVEKAVIECEKIEQVFAYRPFLLLRAINAMDSGQPETARKTLKKFRQNEPHKSVSSNAQEQFAWKGYLAYTIEAALAEHEGRPKQFVHYADKALKAVARKQGLLDIYFTYTFLARRFARLERLEIAQKLLERLDAFLAPLETPYFKAHTQLMLASVLYTRGKENSARIFLRKAVHTAKQHDYDYLFLYKEKNRCLQLKPVLMDEEKNFDFIAHILINLDSSFCKKLGLVLPEEKPEKKICIIQALAANACRDAERQICACFRDADSNVAKEAKKAADKLRNLPPLPLIVHTFGGFTLRIGGRQIKAGVWKRKKALSLFNYFIMHPNKEITPEKLMDTFFSEDSPEKARTHIHTLISHLRRMLEPGLPNKKDSKYIKAENRAYIFVLPEDSYVDALDCERL
ncbi:MAG: hypothetical protein ACLFUN_00755 [Desulfobacterales bacterium]